MPAQPWLPFRRQLEQLRDWMLAPAHAWALARRARLERRLAVKVARAGDEAASRGRLLLMALWFPGVPVARALGGNPSTPRIVLRVFAHGPWDVAAAVAANASTPQGVLAGAFNMAPYWAVRNALASNASAPAITLARLAKNYDVPLRMRTAANPALPSQSVDALLRDPEVYVRAVAATNPSASAEALAALARPMTEPAWVLRAVAANPTCPRALSDEILTWIALGGTGNTDPTFDPLTCRGHPGDTTVDVYSWYRKETLDGDTEMHPLWRVRAAVTTTWPRIPAKVLMGLAVDPEVEVRRSVSGFIELTYGRLRHLTKDADAQVAESAIRALKNKGRGPYWLRVTPARVILLFLVFTGFIVSLALGPHVGSNDPPISGSVAVLPGGTDNGLPVALPGGGQVVAQPLNGVGTGVLILSAGSEALDIVLPVPAYTPFGSLLGSDVRLEPSSTTTVTVTPTSPFFFLQITADQSTGGTPTNLPIDYKELRQ